MKSIKYYFLFLFFYSMHLTYGQNLEIQWQNCFGDALNNKVSCIAPTNQGYLFGMRATEPGPPNYHGSSDVWLVHIDTIGNVLWEKCYGGSNGEAPHKIIRISDDEYYIYGATNSTDGDVESLNHGGSDIWIIKINSNGDIIWERQYGGYKSEALRSAILTPDGGLLVLNRIWSAGGDISGYYGNNDIWLFKIDDRGTIEWEITYGNQYLDNAVDILLTSDSCILMTGANDKAGGMVTCHPNADYSADVWLLKLDMQGNIIWQGCYGGTYYDLAYQALEVEDGFIISASTSSNDGDVSGFHGLPGYSNPSDIWVFKIDLEGNLLWQRCFGGTKNESNCHFSQTEDGNFIIIGTTSSNDGDVSGNHSFDSEYDIWMVEFSDGGEILWQHCYGGLRDEYLEGANPVCKISDNNYVIVANTSTYATDDVQCELYGHSDAWVFEIKDCSQYPTEIPQMPSGADTLCSNVETNSVYIIPQSAGASYYQWHLSPENAGTISGDSLLGTVNWSSDFEGTASIVSRSANECGESQWSQPHYTQVYTCLGTEELLMPKIKVYPNPATKHVIFELPVIARSIATKQSPQIIITNTYGQQITQLEVKDNKTVWDTRAILTGIYFYTFMVDGFSKSGKVIIHH